MDSTACFIRAIEEYDDVRVLAFDYGQPHRDAEIYAAHALAVRRYVPFERVILADCLHSGLLASVPQHEPGGTGPHRAFVPMRNLVFLSVATARALAYWPEGGFDVVFGPCMEDAEGFADCREPFIGDIGRAVRSAGASDVQIRAPFAGTPKAEIIEWIRRCHPSSLEDLQRSWSCYAGKRPCGTCTPCVLRREAFAAAGLEDLSAEPRLHGGDVDRERRLRG
jgi:7-cyano-7-deazaguanine synthase